MHKKTYDVYNPSSCGHPKGELFAKAVKRSMCNLFPNLSNITSSAVPVLKRWIID